MWPETKLDLFSRNRKMIKYIKANRWNYMKKHKNAQSKS